MKMKKLFALLLVLLFVAGMLTGCAAKPMQGEYDSAHQGKQENGLAAPEKPQTPAAPENRKLIRTQYIEAETEDMDSLLAEIDSRVAQLGGYIEDRTVHNGSAYSSGYTRNADMTLRIPVASMDTFIDQMEEQANILSTSETSEDVTLTYIATQSRITALETEQTRLLELLAIAENMNDLLLIEARLTEVRAELENVTSQLRLYDNLVDYGTIHLNLREVKTFTVAEETLGQRISGGFARSMKSLGNGLTELMVFLLTRLPYLIPLAVIGSVVLVIIRLTERKRRKKEKAAQSDPSSEDTK